MIRLCWGNSHVFVQYKGRIVHTILAFEPSVFEWRGHCPVFILILFDESVTTVFAIRRSLAFKTLTRRYIYYHCIPCPRMTVVKVLSFAARVQTCIATSIILCKQHLIHFAIIHFPAFAHLLIWKRLGGRMGKGDDDYDPHTGAPLSYWNAFVGEITDILPCSNPWVKSAFVSLNFFASVNLLNSYVICKEYAAAGLNKIIYTFCPPGCLHDERHREELGHLSWVLGRPEEERCQGWIDLLKLLLDKSCISLDLVLW